ncbi:MAG: DMT family transporter [Gammaproteobacteria bacterium]|nr:DMT family transporter [Gammaproteobacteria bacterium]
MKKSTIANLMLVGVTAMWGLTFPLIHSALSDINPGLFVVLRLSVAALVIVPFVCFRLTKVNTVLLLGCLALALLNTGTYLFQTQGLLTVPASRSAFITGLSVVMVPLFMPFFRQFFPSTKPDLIAYISVAVCLVGLYILTGANLRQLSIGDLWTFGCAVCYALYIIVMQIMSVRERDFALLCFYQIFFCVPFTLPFAHAMPAAQLLQWPVITAVVFCAVFATSLSIYLQSRYQRDTTATKTALIFALEPVFATIFAYFLNDSAITLSTLIGGILILLSIVLRDVWVAMAVQR